MTWTPVDQHQPVDEARAIAGALAVVEDLDRTLAADGRATRAALANLRRWVDDGIRAAQTSTPTTGTPMWCDTHDRNLRRCQTENLTCTGTPYRPGADPAGEAAIDRHTSDHAHATRTEILALLRDLARIGTRLPQLVADHQTRPGAGSPGPDVDWCRSCYRDDHHHTPIDRRPDGAPYYAGLCRWCGAFRAAEGVEPPLEILRARHAGRTVTTRMVSRAVAHERARSKRRHR